MIFSPPSRRHSALAFASLFWSLGLTPAQAQTQAAPSTAGTKPSDAGLAARPGDTTPEDTTPPNPDVTGQREADAGLAAASNGSQPLGFVERLPASAYPSFPLRGIYGGSLWRTFHGLQWPYYPKTGIGVSGYGWIDTGFVRKNSGDASTHGDKTLVQEGRVLVRVTPTWSNGRYFVQAQAELVANKDQSQKTTDVPIADDVWVRFGQWNIWDFRVGRYETWELYHYGMGLDLNTVERKGAQIGAYGAPGIYGVNYMFDRPAGIGGASAHLYPSKNLRFELAGQLGNQGQNSMGIRPVAVFDLGWLKLKAGGEYLAQEDAPDGSKGSQTRRGVGGAVQFVANPYVEFGVNGATGLADVYKDGAYDSTASNTTYSVGGFVNVQPLASVVPDLLLGGGYDLTYLEDQHYQKSLGRNGKFRHTQTFVAVQYYLWRQLFIKAVAGYAKADLAPTFGPALYSNEMLSARLRFECLF